MAAKQLIKQNFLLIFFLLFLVPLSTLITTEKSLAFSISDEKELGEKLFFKVRKKFPLLDDPDITGYINALGGEVLQAADAPYFDYHFFIIGSEKFNAFAVPSGLIFFYSGLIERINHENELAAVMAHEVGHVVKRHIAQSIRQQKIGSVAALAAAILGAGVGGKGGSAIMGSAIAANKSAALHYSREHEEEADLLAYDWLRKMGRGAEGEIAMLQTMHRIARYRSNKLPEYLLSHPNPEERLWTVQSFMDSDDRRAKSSLQDRRKIDNFAFLRFKYRVITQALPAYQLRPRLAAFLARPADGQEEREQKVMAQYGLALVAREEKNYPKALELLENVIAVYPEKPILLADKGVFEMEAGRLEEAEESLRRAERAMRDGERKEGGDMYTAFALGKLMKRARRFADADRYFARVAAAMPSYPEVWFQRGEIEKMRGNSGLSHFYLAQSELYRGRITPAKRGFLAAERDVSLPAEILRQVQRQLALIGRLEGRNRKREKR